MANAAQARNVAVDLKVIRWVSEGEISPFLAKQGVVVFRQSGIAADQLVPTQQPKVRPAGHWRSAQSWNVVISSVGPVGISLRRVVEDEVRLGQAETRQFNIVVQVDEALELDCEDLALPASVERQLVVGKDVRSPVRF